MSSFHIQPARRLAALCLGLLCLGPLCLVAGARADSSPAGPRATVVSAVRGLVDAVSACRFQLATDPAALRALADRTIRPALDVYFAGQLILGKWWGTATPDQRRAFSQALYGSLANRYGPSLLLVTAETVAVGPAGDPPAAAGEAVVPVVVRVPGQPPVPVDLVLRRSNDRWRVYDARFEGLSPVLQLREQFSEEIRREGLDGVIARLEKQAAPAAPGGRAGRCLAQGDAP